VLVESIAMCVAGLALATANARRDARKRPLDCLRCGYPLDGVAANRCPECGAQRRVKPTPADRERS
jgi:DNA-directed RNA polymerase subunit RPC12/RpoP